MDKCDHCLEVRELERQLKEAREWIVALEQEMNGLEGHDTKMTELMESAHVRVDQLMVYIRKLAAAAQLFDHKPPFEISDASAEICTPITGGNAGLGAPGLESIPREEMLTIADLRACRRMVRGE